jgi:hypothetical protein
MFLMKARTDARLLTVCVAGISALIAAGPGCVDRVQSVRFGPLDAPEWNRIFCRTDGWTGGDCAGTVPLPGGRTLWLFGDSWIGPVREGRHAEGSAMVNNAIAVHGIAHDGVPATPDSVEFLWGQDAAGKPAAWVVPSDEESSREKNLRYWPTGGGDVVTESGGGRSSLFVFLMRIRDRSDSKDDVWNFEGCGSAVVRVENPADPPRQWRKQVTTLTRPSSPIPPMERRIAWGAAAMVSPTDPMTVLIYGVDSTDGLNKKLLLARAPASSVDQFDNWSFKSAEGWSDRPADAASIADMVMDEFSMDRMEIGGVTRCVMVYNRPILDDHIVVRLADQPEGPWSFPREIYRCPEPSQDKRLMAYSAKAHPELSKPGELLITYCVNSQDFWHMAGDASIYRPRFVSVPVWVIAAVDRTAPDPVR